jgi:hypothetical protein
MSLKIKMKVTYLACNYEDDFPIISADSFENIRKALDQYCGADNRNIAKFIGFVPYETKHGFGTEYEGYMQYECRVGNRDWIKPYISKFKIYCIEFYPLAKVEENTSFDNPSEKIQVLSWVNDCTCSHQTGVVNCCDECGLPFETQPKVENKGSFGEISDEEIEKEISKRYMHPTQDYAFRDACKWYREQLKQL